MHIRTVKRTLERIGADDAIPRLTVWTKCDAVDGGDIPGSSVATSSRTGEGLDMLLDRIMEYRDNSLDWFRLELDHHHSRTISWLYSDCIVRDVNVDSTGRTSILAGALRGYDSIRGRLAGSNIKLQFQELAGPDEYEGTSDPGRSEEV